MKDSFNSKTPQSDLLKKHIAYYYFHDVDEDNTARSFIYYPHFKNALSIYKNSSFILEDLYSTITRPSKRPYSFGFTKLTSHAAKAEIHPPFHKIGVVFQPLGLNYFLENHLSSYLTQSINLDFDYFKPSITPVLDEVYATHDIDKKVSLLDAYFLSVYKGFKEPKIEKAMDLLFQTDAKLTVAELAEQLDINRKTLLRLFRKHQNCSVIDYIKLIQFRKSIEVFQNETSRTSFTKLAMENEYYDQSDFIHHFKKLTGFNPKSFFKGLSNLGNQGTYWTFN